MLVKAFTQPGVVLGAYEGISLVYFRTVITGVALWACATAFAEEGVASDSKVEPEQLEKLTTTISAALSGVDVEGWQRSTVERYVVENLYDKINGRSELYMSYGVRGMVFATYTRAARPKDFIDVFLYDMGSAAGAFGVYSVERWGDWEPATWGREGYCTETDAFFWKGRYYATVLGSSSDAAVRGAQQRIARLVADSLSDTNESLWGLSVLPEDRLVPGSIRYFMVDALSLGFMENTFTAEYRYGDVDVTVFVSKRPSDADASSACDAFLDYMKKYGEAVSTEGPGDQLLHTGDMGGGHFDAVFVQGAYVAGVTSVPDRTLAVEAANDLRRRLRESR